MGVGEVVRAWAQMWEQAGLRGDAVARAWSQGNASGGG